MRWCRERRRGREWPGGERSGRERSGGRQHGGQQHGSEQHGSEQHGSEQHGPLAAALLTLAGLAALVLAGGAGAYLDGPPPAHTGGFGEPTCAACHRGEPLDDAGGSLTLGAPSEYAPGGEHVLEVRLARAAMPRAGFQLSARFAAGGLAGRQAGELTAMPPAGEAAAVQVVAAHDVAYAAHTAAGAAPASGGEVRWRVCWRAPGEAAGPVVFHVAANAGNFDDSELGDFVYLASAVSRPRSPEPPPGDAVPGES